MSISLKVEPVVGEHILDVLESAFRVAVALNISHAYFDFNGGTVAVYPDGRAVEIGGEHRRWRRVGRQGWMKQ